MVYFLSINKVFSKKRLDKTPQVLYIIGVRGEREHSAVTLTLCERNLPMFIETGILHRHESNPLIVPQDIPYDCKRVYNPAACLFDGKYALILRIEDHQERQLIGLATSEDGIHFTVEPRPILAPAADEYGKLNDPRITLIDGWYYLTYCSDPSWPHQDEIRDEGIFLCIARSRDLHNWERIYKSEPDNRNGVIFPEKINGLYARLDRPFKRGYRKTAGYDIWISYSPDMEFWGRHRLVLSHLDIPWGMHKIGPGVPPVKTDQGWLVIFHGALLVDSQQKWKIWSCGNRKVYCAGVMLLDLADPSKIRGVCKKPILVPTESYEMDEVYRPNVVFPSGAILENDGQLKIYYGASDTSVALATAPIDVLVDCCLGGGAWKAQEGVGVTYNTSAGIVSVPGREVVGHSMPLLGRQVLK